MDEKFYFFEDTKKFKSDVGTSVLSRKEEQFLLLLAKNKVISYETLCKSIYNSDCFDELLKKRLTILKHRLQKKTGLPIEVVDNKGYYTKAKIDITTQFGIL